VHGHDAHGHGHDDAHGHGGPVKESPASMTLPLTVLAILSVVGGFLGMGKPFLAGESFLARWLAPVMESGPQVPVHEMSPGTEWGLMALSVAVAALGIGMAFQAYLRQPSLATRLRERFAGLQRLLENKYWVDELYDTIAVRPIYRSSQALWRIWDTKVVDGMVNGVGYVMEGFSAVLRLVQTGSVGTYALWLALGVLALILHFLRH
jgi:NADH-quinone oxidoreductase subunit L